MPMFDKPGPVVLTPELEEQKKNMYEKMSDRRKRFIDRIGYENWDPFQAPKDPINMRTDVTQRTTQQLIREFLQTCPEKEYSSVYGRAALECTLGLVNDDERYKAIFRFCVWYNELLQQEGVSTDE